MLAIIIATVLMGLNTVCVAAAGLAIGKDRQDKGGIWLLLVVGWSMASLAISCARYL